MIHVLLAASLALLAPKDIGAPGAQILIAHDGRIDEQDYGVRNATSRLPVDSHTRFEIGSVTKQFTAAAILQLKEQGKLSLQDPLGKYIPEYVPGRDVTIEQLLHQTSGIPDYIGTKAFSGLVIERNRTMLMREPITLSRALSFIAGKPLEFKPGSRWEYSNTNYLFLGKIVELVSGMPYESYVRTHIFAPAKMTESAFMENERTLTDVATGYAMSTKTHRKIVADPMRGAGGDGGIVSTAQDLERWDAALFGGAIITKTDLALMTAPGPVRIEPDAHYGFGWMVDRFYGADRLDHNGETLGFTASNQVYPSLGIYVIVLTNAGYAHTSEVADLALLHRDPQIKAAYVAPIAGEPPALDATARELWTQLMSGTLQRSMYTPSLYSFLVAHLDVPRRGFGHLGAPTAFNYRGTVPVHRKGIAAYKYELLFHDGVNVGLEFFVDARHRIAGVLFVP